MNILRLLFLSVLCSYIAVACSSNTEQKENSYTGVSLSDVGGQHPLKDDMTLLGTIGATEKLDNNRWIISDNSPGIYLFEDYTMTASFGKKGKGPCEYQSVSALDVKGDTLFVLSSMQGKIITFNINSQKCLGEFSNNKLRGAFFFYRQRKAPAYITGRTSYTALTPDSTVLSYRIFDDGTAQPLDLKLSRIHPVNTVVQLRYAGTNFSKRGKDLYAYYPLTDSLYILNLDTYRYRSFPLRIDVKRKELEKAGQDVDKILKIIQGDFQMAGRVLTSDKWVAIRVLQQAAREGEKPIGRLQFYTPDGSYIGQVSSDHQVAGVDNGRLIEIVQNTDPKARYTYSMISQKVILK